MLKMAELVNLSVGELEEKVGQLKKDLMQYRFQAKTGKLERQNVLKEVKRDIARALTVISQKQKEAASERGKESAKV